MKKKKYTGMFYSDCGQFHHKQEVYCFGFIQAFYLLTSNEIEKGLVYQLNDIIDEYDNIKLCNDMLEFKYFKDI